MGPAAGSGKSGSGVTVWTGETVRGEGVGVAEIDGAAEEVGNSGGLASEFGQDQAPPMAKNKKAEKPMPIEIPARNDRVQRPPQICAYQRFELFSPMRQAYREHGTLRGLDWHNQAQFRWTLLHETRKVSLSRPFSRIGLVYDGSFFESSRCSV
jgi:hypothetical protein